MGELVQFDGGLPNKPNATVGQALFAAIVDELETMEVGIIPRSLIATAAKHGRAALDDGVQPEIVLVGCIVALQQGKPQFTAHIIGDICFAKAGATMTPQEYRHYLSLESRQNNPAVSAVREAMEARRRKAIGRES